MGEIGVPRHEYLYELSYCEIVLIARGYSRRSREMWSAVRWQTYSLMLVSGADMRKAGISSPADLLPFPWESEDDDSSLPDDEEIRRLQRLMAEENAAL